MDPSLPPIVLSVVQGVLREDDPELPRPPRHAFLLQLLGPLKFTFDPLAEVLGSFHDHKGLLKWIEKTHAHMRSCATLNEAGRHVWTFAYARVVAALVHMDLIAAAPGAPGCLVQSGWRGFFDTLSLQRGAYERHEMDLMNSQVLDVHARASRLRRVVVCERVTNRGTVSRLVRPCIIDALETMVRIAGRFFNREEKLPVRV